MSIKLIASDLDGTLLTNTKELSEKNRKVLSEAVKKGVYIVPATGRSYQAVPDIIKEFPGVEYIITANGGAVYSVGENRRIYECLLKDSSVEACLRVKKAEDVIMEVFIEGIPYSEEIYIKDPAAYGATEYGVKYIRATRKPIKDIVSFAWKNRNKLDSVAFVCRKKETQERLYRELENEIPEVYVTSSVQNLIEIGHINAGKGKTLLWLLDRLKISRDEVAAFGDADNDCSMIEAVKYGIAMGNATENCKKCAVCVTETNENDGVAIALEKLL